MSSTQTIASDGTSNIEWPTIVEANPTSFKIEVKLNQEIFLDMELTNTTQSLVSFKVKTTARDRYLLRPTQDYISPNSKKICKIVMARLTEYPDLSNPKMAKDKFLVQSCIVKEQVPDLSKMWKDLEQLHAPKNNRFAYHEQRVKCKLTLPKMKGDKEKPSTPSADPSSASRSSRPSSPAHITPIPIASFNTASTSTATSASLPSSSSSSSTTSSSTVSSTMSTSTPASGNTSARDVDDDDQQLLSARGKESETVIALRSALDRRVRENDETMDFAVKLTAQNERLKVEVATLTATQEKKSNTDGNITTEN